MIDHPLNPRTFNVHPGHELFTRSTDGGAMRSPAVEVGGGVGTLSDTEWWIDRDLSTDGDGNLYATWDTQTSAGDIGWLSYSTDGGRTWSAPTRVILLVGTDCGCSRVSTAAGGRNHDQCS